MESYPTFHNEVGVPIVRIGCREFKCIGDNPPQDHPHIYLKIGDASEIVCPYCSTLFRFDPSLGAHEADPEDCAYERQAPSSRSLETVHDGHERSEFGRMQASRRPNQR